MHACYCFIFIVVCNCDLSAKIKDVFTLYPSGSHKILIFTPGVRTGGWVFRRCGKSLSGLHFRNRVRWFYLIGTLVRGCMYATSWCGFDLTFDLAIVTLSLKILPGLYLRSRKMQDLDTS